MVNKEKINEIFGQLEKDQTVAILVQNPPDPDCLGAAAGFGVLLKEAFSLQSKIYHYGEISHAQNKAMKNVLHIQLRDGNDFDANDYTATVVLDTDLTASGFASEDFVTPSIRIDHHEMDREPEPLLKDIRPVGSTCSIIWDYLREFEIDLSNYSDAATAMILGIRTDTLDFTSQNVADLDMEAYRSLLPYVDKIALARVINFPLPKETFELEALAYSNKQERGTTLVSFVGELAAHSRDSIATIADRFARMAGIHTVVIMALIGDYLHASVRSDDARVDVNDLCMKVFGKEFSGAKEGSGGAKVPLEKNLEYIKSKEVREQVIYEIVSTFTNKVFEVLGEDNE